MRFLAIVVILVSVVRSQAAEPTKAETEAFIVAKCIKVHKSDPGAMQSVQFKDGELRVVWTFTKAQQPVKIRTYSVFLKDLDPSRVAISDHDVDFRVYDDQLKVKITYQDGDKKTENTTYGYSLLTENERHALQVQAALAHLIKLYGGKPELFP